VDGGPRDAPVAPTGAGVIDAARLARRRDGLVYSAAGSRFRTTMRCSLLPVALVVSGAMVSSACGHHGNASDGVADAGTGADAAPATPDAGASGPPPPLFHPMTSLDDAQLATQARALLGPAGAGCRGCHPVDSNGLRSWATLGSDLLQCLGDRDLASLASAQRMVGCLRTDPNNPSSLFTPRKLGWFAAAARLDWFEYVFKKAYGSDWQGQLTALRSRAAMPRGGMHKLTQAEFDIVAEWFNRGLPQLASIVAADLPRADCVDDLCPAAAVDAASTDEPGEAHPEQEQP